MLQPPEEVTANKVLIPNAKIEVKREDWGKMKKKQPGARVRVVLVGTIKDIYAMTADQDGTRSVGDFTLEVKEMQIGPAPDGEIAELFVDDD